MPLYTMERHERYDPEDIESLLSDRGFDELLPDERAFVLRHLSGRDEYERMRAMLHYVRPDERERGTIDPDDRVRSNVMAAFRAQQQPQWRIWLNGISLWLAPKEAPALWRPVLAFGSLALLIVAGVVAVRQFEGTTDQASIAELKQEEHPPAPSTPKKEEPQEAEAREVTGLMTDMDQQTPATGDALAKEALVTTTLTDMTMHHKDAEAKTYAATEDMVATVHVEADYAMKRVPEPPPATRSSEVAEESISRVVTAEDLARNMSVTNALGEVAKETTSKMPRRKLAAAEEHSTSRSLADDPGLLSLVATGW